MEDVLKILSDFRQLNQTSKQPFNLFTMLLQKHSEAYLHSSFLSWLLDPKAPHKLGVLPMHLFLKKIGSHHYSVDKETTHITPNAINKTEEGDIDILIEDEEQDFAIIIENKIYAGDSNTDKTYGQLQKYFWQVRESQLRRNGGANIEKRKIFHPYKEENIEVYYLTPDGHEPSLDSTSKADDLRLEISDEVGGKKVKLISYMNHVLPWLKELLHKEEVIRNTYVHEIIAQYIDVVISISCDIERNKALFELVSNFTLNQLGQLKEIIKKYELEKDITKRYERIVTEEQDNAETIDFILNNIKHIYWHALAAFFDDLSRELEEQLKPLGVTKVEHPENLADQISNIIHQRKKEHPYFGFWYEGVWWTIQLNEISKRFMLGIDKANNATIDQNKLNRLAIDNEINNENEDGNWWFIKSFEIVINPWNFLDEDLRLEAFFNLLSKPTRQGTATTYAEFVKYILIKFMSYVDSFGVYFSKDKKILEFASRYLRGTYTIPHSVEKINAYAFCNYNHLTSVEIPNSVKEIGTGAFYECKSLQEIIIPFGQKIRFSQMEGLKGLEDKIIEREP